MVLCVWKFWIILSHQRYRRQCPQSRRGGCSSHSSINAAKVKYRNGDVKGAGRRQVGGRKEERNKGQGRGGWLAGAFLLGIYSPKGIYPGIDLGLGLIRALLQM